MARTQHVALKGTRDGLVLYLDPRVEFEIIVDELQQHLKESAQFLHGASVRCYAADKQYLAQQLDTLGALLKEHGLELSGWLNSEEVYVPGKNPAETSNDKEVRSWEEGMTEGSSLFVEKTLRSGKSVQFDGHVIVLGDVNPGAEIIASGNIIVLGSLRGVAHAGASGDRKAIVSAYHLAPTQLRIADLVTRPPDDEDSWRGPETAKVKDGRLIVEGLVMNGRTRSR